MAPAVRDHPPTTDENGRKSDGQPDPRAVARVHVRKPPAVTRRRDTIFAREEVSLCQGRGFAFARERKPPSYLPQKRRELAVHSPNPLATMLVITAHT